MFVAQDNTTRVSFCMMTSSNGTIFRATVPLCGEFTDHRWIPRIYASDAEFWCILWSVPEPTVELSGDLMFSLICAWTNSWANNGHAVDFNHQPHDCLLNRLFRRRSKKTSKLRVTGLCAGKSPGTDELPTQMASNAENVSISWRHHENNFCSSIIVIQSLFIYALNNVPTRLRNQLTN